MWKDPIVEEVRAIRDKQARALHYNLRNIVAKARRAERASGRRIVSFAKKKRTSPAVPVTR